MRTLIGALAVLLVTSFAHAQAPSSPAYRYVDERGVIHWAQSIHLVPERYAAKAVMPDFRDASIFPTPGAYVKPATPTRIVVTLPHESQPKPSHQRYLNEVRRILTAAWRGRGWDNGEQPWVSFYVVRDGRLTMPEIERSSGNVAYDLRARDTIMSLRRLPPPPDVAGGPMRVQVRFAFVK
jgi:TonB family protein